MVKKMNRSTVIYIDVAIIHQENGYLPDSDTSSSLVVIKDCEANQYLDYYDEKWGATDITKMLRQLYNATN